MKAHFELKSIIQNLKDQDHLDYESLIGSYLFNNFTFIIDRIETSSNFAILTTQIQIDQTIAGFPEDSFNNRSREVALRDFLNRCFYHATLKHSCNDILIIEIPGQEILERTSVFITPSIVEVRSQINLPSSIKDLDPGELEKILFQILPEIIESSLKFENLDKDELYTHIETSEDADFLRNELENLRLIAFVAEKSVLARDSENKSLPLDPNKAIPFKSPYNLSMDVELPNKGQISGLGLPRGITFITGAQDQGKSTLINAIQSGIYNHIPGDGREFVVSNPNSVKIYKEEGRRIKDVNISAFFPSLEEANNYSNEKASELVSQAANTIEAIEVGADVLLIEEDSSAEGFLINEDTENNAFKPFITKVQSLFREYMVSSILAAENLESYIDNADFILKMENFVPIDMSEHIDTENNVVMFNENFGYFSERIPSLETQEIDDLTQTNLNSILSILSDSQLNTIYQAIKYSRKYMDGKKTFRQVTSLVMLDIGRSGLDVLDPNLSANKVEFRKIELAAVLNRLSSISVTAKN